MSIFTIRPLPAAALAAFLLTACGEDHTEGVATATVSDPAAPTTPTTPPEGATNPAPEGATGEIGVPTTPAPTTVAIPIAREGSSVGFTGAKVTGSHDGTFADFSGTIDLADEITESRIAVTIQIGSLVIEPERLHGHLLSPDLFDATAFPTATFESTAIVAGSDARVGETPATHTVTGNLTLHGQTHAITFPAIIELTDAEIRSRAEFVINRRDFGIVYPGMPDDLIRDEVVIRYDVHAPRT